ncbi:triacylglycerol lipase [Microbulbifer donghaiensis]|uniref:Triacylglycerol lipase n=1 Tax=Microbulbifer donghaiensis TaxID=494016 RepID=A0A1M5FHZ5_9GAMM|nr:lipase [Microbulbifer donghaiensis]SHF91170.1 triacylglycerol lipase [Microbulbifer donghaiensis]
MKAQSDVALLIPGIFDRGHSMLLMQQALKDAGFSAHYIHLRYNSGWHGMEHLSLQLKHQVDALVAKHETCAIVGFSMGGIVARHYLQVLGGIERVHKFISISSPHFGSLWAGFLPYKGGRQLRIGSDFLNALNSDVQCLSCTAPVSIWTRYDITIVPHTSSRLPIGEYYEFPVKLHRWMPFDREVIAAVTGELVRARN